ncbi:hypothetical protein DI270_017365 [Microbispora triticiradicis]|uniref:Uncharacterized protein n=1 Tax=Microbispora triticiradicis TaxID=2200763 RepID=A0ABX9LI75_9ACTN|nr:hypothetical protein DI270_017365 [Microbispora triticiradicis]
MRALVLDVAAEATRLGSRAPRITDDTLTQWITEGAAQVAGRIRGYAALAPATTVQIEAQARGLVHLYAASFLADASHPERAAGRARLGEVYWERYTAGLNQLTAWVRDVIDTGQGSGGPPGSAAWAFPPPRITDRTTW